MSDSIRVQDSSITRSRIKQNMQDRLLSLTEMASRLNRCPKTFRRYVDKYDIPHIRVERSLYFDPFKVIKFLETLSTRRREERLAHKTINRSSARPSLLASRLGL